MEEKSADGMETFLGSKAVQSGKDLSLLEMHIEQSVKIVESVSRSVDTALRCAIKIGMAIASLENRV